MRVAGDSGQGRTMRVALKCLKGRFRWTWGLSGSCRGGKKVKFDPRGAGGGLGVLWTSVKVNPGKGWVKWQ